MAPYGHEVNDARRLALLVFFQMLPATLVAPAIRPLFAMQHGGGEGPMHAFMALNMLGALVAAPIVGLHLDRGGRPRPLFFALCLADACLLAAVATPLPTSVVLGLRTLEGAAHVGAATILLAEASSLARASGSGRVMGLTGGALMLAVALGSGLGGAVVGLDPRAPFFLGALTIALVLLASHRVVLGGRGTTAEVDARPPIRTILARARTLVVPVGAAFVGRFTVGLLVVTFALFAHHAHGLSDAAIGGLFTLLTFPFALAMYPAARLGDRVPRAIVLVAGASLYALALFCLPIAGTLWLAPLMLVAGLGSAAVFACTLCYAVLAAGDMGRASAMSLVNAAGCLGMLLGPAVAGIVSFAVKRTTGDPVSGYRAVLALAGAAIVVFGLSSMRFLRERYRCERRAITGGSPSGSRFR
jgi:MFS family permease